MSSVNMYLCRMSRKPHRIYSSFLLNNIDFQMIFLRFEMGEKRQNKEMNSSCVDVRVRLNSTDCFQNLRELSNRFVE